MLGGDVSGIHRDGGLGEYARIDQEALTLGVAYPWLSEVSLCLGLGSVLFGSGTHEGLNASDTILVDDVLYIVGDGLEDFVR